MLEAEKEKGGMTKLHVTSILAHIDRDLVKHQKRSQFSQPTQLSHIGKYLGIKVVDFGFLVPFVLLQ
jgi:hypothetical protein